MATGLEQPLVSDIDAKMWDDYFNFKFEKQDTYVFRHRPVMAWRYDTEQNKWRSRGEGQLTMYPHSKGELKLVFHDEIHSERTLLQYIDGKCKFIYNQCTVEGSSIVEWKATDLSIETMPMTDQWKLCMDLAGIEKFKQSMCNFFEENTNNKDSIKRESVKQEEMKDEKRNTISASSSNLIKVHTKWSNGKIGNDIKKKQNEKNDQQKKELDQRLKAKQSELNKLEEKIAALKKEIEGIQSKLNRL